MNIQVNKDGNNIRILLDGKLDTNTSPELSKVLDELPDQIEELKFDLAKLSYISSAGLRVMINSTNLVPEGKTPVLQNVSDFVKDTMTMTGILEMFTII